MSFLYILRCMLFILVSGTSSVSDDAGNDIIVGVLGWVTVYIIICLTALAVSLIRRHIRQKRGLPEEEPKELNSDVVEKQLQEKINNNKFYKWFVYVSECAMLTFLYNGNDKKLKSTGKKATKKEYLTFFWFWSIIAADITFVVLLCVLFK